MRITAGLNLKEKDSERPPFPTPRRGVLDGGGLRPPPGDADLTQSPSVSAYLVVISKLLLGSFSNTGTH
jgi:hypothetical protein